MKYTQNRIQELETELKNLHARQEELIKWQIGAVYHIKDILGTFTVLITRLSEHDHTFIVIDEGDYYGCIYSHKTFKRGENPFVTFIDAGLIADTLKIYYEEYQGIFEELEA